MRFASFILLGACLSVYLTGCEALAIIACQNAKLAAAAGMDSDTDAIGGGLALECGILDSGVTMQALPEQTRPIPDRTRRVAPAGATIAPGVFFGFGSQDFGDVDPMTGEPLSYTVLQLGVHGQYAIPLNSDGSLSAGPIAGPGYYRFSYSDCPFSDECSENLFVLDLGGGVQYGNFGVEAFTGLGGPNLRLRAKYSIPLQ